MNLTSQRFILWLFALLLISSLIKGHCRQTESGPTVAFDHLSSGGIKIRVRGDVPRPGIYRLPDGSTLETVIKMAIDKAALFRTPGVGLQTAVKPGMIVEMTTPTSGNYEISVRYMSAKERMILNIPLDLHLMNEADWEALPGIGHETAHNIILYRQNNGDFSSLWDLKNVAGISDGKIKKIAAFFYGR